MYMLYPTITCPVGVGYLATDTSKAWVPGPLRTLCILTCLPSRISHTQSMPMEGFLSHTMFQITAMASIPQLQSIRDALRVRIVYETKSKHATRCATECASVVPRSRVLVDSVGGLLVSYRYLNSHKEPLTHHERAQGSEAGR